MSIDKAMVHKFVINDSLKCMKLSLMGFEKAYGGRVVLAGSVGVSR